MKRTVAWHVAIRAPRGSCGGREPVSFGLLDQYLLSNLHDSVSFDLIVSGDGNYRTGGRTRV